MPLGGRPDGRVFWMAQVFQFLVHNQVHLKSIANGDHPHVGLPANRLIRTLTPFET
jgi:hypothetical protein